MSNIFEESRRRQSDAVREFRLFRTRAIATIPTIAASIDRFDCLKSEFSFWIDTTSGDDHLQVNFGKRKMGVLNLDDTPAVEKGGSIVFSLGRTGGVVATVLYPASSDLGSTIEDHIFLRVGPYSGLRMLSYLESDIRDLVSYTFISSLETTPSWRDHIRLTWLRRTHPQQIAGAFVNPNSPSKLLATGFRFTATSLLVALLRPIGNLLVYLLLIYFGFAYLVPHIK